MTGDSIERTSAIGGFRGRFYRRLGRRAGALFELTDTILTAGSVPSPPHLSAPTSSGPYTR